MLVHSQEPEPGTPEERRYWEPNWSVWRWVAIALVVGYAAVHADGAVGAILVFTSFYAACRSLVHALPYPGGLTEWRQ